MFDNYEKNTAEALLGEENKADGAEDEEDAEEVEGHYEIPAYVEEQI